MAGEGDGFSGVLGPISSLLGIGSGVYSMLEGNRQQSKARDANEQRYRMLLDLYRTQAMSAKAGVALSGQQERADITQRHIGTGLYNSTVLDTANNMSRNRESLQNQAIDAQMTGQMAGTIEGRTDAYPNLSGMGASMGAVGQNFAALLGSLSPEKKTSSETGAKPAASKPQPTYAGDDATPMQRPSQTDAGASDPWNNEQESPFAFGRKPAPSKRRFKVTSNRTSSYAVQ